MKTGIELIAQERQEQIEKHDFDLIRDLKLYYDNDELHLAAVWCLMQCGLIPYFECHPPTWGEWFKERVEAKKKRMNTIEFRIEMEIIAAALLASDIDVLRHKNMKVTK